MHVCACCVCMQLINAHTCLIRARSSDDMPCYHTRMQLDDKSICRSSATCCADRGLIRRLD